jgi:hypothetical protein
VERLDYTYVFNDLSDIPNAVRLGGNTAANIVPTCKVIIDDGQFLSLRRVPAEVADLNRSTRDSYTRCSRHVEITRLPVLSSVPMSCGLI